MYNHEELKAAFELVEDKRHWKNPINTVIEIDDERQMRLIREAVIYFTGSVPEFEKVNYGQNRYHVTAAGYFETIGV